METYMNRYNGKEVKRKKQEGVRGKEIVMKES